MKKLKSKDLLRNFTFGVEDSLVSTVGLLSGVAAGGISKGDLIITGAILIFVEAMSMGVGSFLTDQSVKEFETHKETSYKSSLPGAMVMFFSYLASGIIPLSPYLLFEINTAFWISIVFSILCLYLLGHVNALRSGTRPYREGIKMALLGGLAIIGGTVIGKLFLINK